MTEIAYAKVNATSATSSTNADLDGIAHGGWPRNAIHALTGQSDTREVQASQLKDVNKVFDLISASIKEHRAVVLATNAMKDSPTDGLVKGNYYAEGSRYNAGHAYTVEAIEKRPDGSVSLTLRNPWGHNKAALQGAESADPIVHVDLRTVLENGHLENVTIGPGVVRKQTEPERAGLNQTSRQHEEPPLPSWSAQAYWTDLARRGAEAAQLTPASSEARGSWAELSAKDAGSAGEASRATETNTAAPRRGHGRST